MGDETPRRTGRSGAVFTALVVGGSAVGVIGWYAFTNRTGIAIDASGFDLSAAPQSPRAAPAAAGAAAAEQPPSSLSFLKGDAGISIGGSNPPAAARPKAADPKDQARDDFTAQARKNEAVVRNFAARMTKKYPIIRQYGRDWMRHPDLRKLNDDYMRDHDPIAFLKGLAHAPSLGAMIKQYAGSPAILGFVTQGLKEAPGDLTSSAMDVLSNDSGAKALVSKIADGIGLPPSVTGMIAGSGSSVDQSQAVSGILSSPAIQNAMKQQGDAPPPVSLNDQR